MTFLTNAWYVFGFPHEFGEKPLSRTILGQALAIFRGEDGAVLAVEDRCPHRFVPLSMGWVEGSQIRCAYHGIAFDGRTGACTDRPTDDGPLNPKLCIRTFPVVERWNMVWGWLGDAEKADPATIPDFPLMVDPAFTHVTGYLKVQANQQLVVDNLLDLSHVQFLHRKIAPKADVSKFVQYAEQEGDRVWQRLFRPGVRPAAAQMAAWGFAGELTDSCGDIRWDVPGVLQAYTANNETGKPPQEGVRFPTCHLLTPETEYSTHYFWTNGRDRDHDNPETDRRAIEQSKMLFETEDGPMIEAQQAALGQTTDFLGQQPVILKSDSAGIRARRIMQRLIRAEQAETASIRAAE